MNTFVLKFWQEAATTLAFSAVIILWVFFGSSSPEGILPLIFRETRRKGERQTEKTIGVRET